MSKIKSLTRAEEEIMQYIWQLGRCTVSNIIDDLKEPKPLIPQFPPLYAFLNEKALLTTNPTAGPMNIFR